MLSGQSYFIVYCCFIIMYFACIDSLMKKPLTKCITEPDWLLMDVLSLMVIIYCLTPGTNCEWKFDVFQVRRAIGDFGVPISIMVMAFLAFLIPYTYIQVICVDVWLHIAVFSFHVTLMLHVVILLDLWLRSVCLQSFDAVGWVAGRASGL